MKWYLDNGCSRYMTSDKSKFIELNMLLMVTTIDVKILDLGVLENPTTTNIEDVLPVKCLRHNLLIISQMVENLFQPPWLCNRALYKQRVPHNQECRIMIIMA